MRIVILTSFLEGTAGNHLPMILEQTNVEVAMVIYNKCVVQNKKKSILRKIKKTFKIGLLGAVNGIRMRKWFNHDMEKYGVIESVDKICKKHNIPFFETDTINSNRTKELFLDAKADLGISLGNGYIGKKIFSIPTYGFINIHHEILPDYKNAQSIIWQIFNDSKYTGYTIHKIDNKIDTGDILYQEKVPIGFKETLKETIAFTSVRLLKASAEGLMKVLNNFEFYYNNARPQGIGRSYTTPSFAQYLKIEKHHNKLKNEILKSGFDPQVKSLDNTY